MTIPFPVPSGLASLSSADDVTAVACTSACRPVGEQSAGESCLHSRASKQGRYFRLMELRGNMDLPLGVCPEGARTVPDLRRAYGRRRARPWVAAAGVLPHPGGCDEFNF